MVINFLKKFNQNPEGKTKRLGRLIFRKNGQLKIQQMAFMLMAVTIFFALAGLFALSIGLNAGKRSFTDIEENNAKLLVMHLANTAEFSCGRSFDTGEINCIDADKVMILKEHTSDYQGFWGVADIKIRKVFPDLGHDVVCTQSNYPRCNVIEVYSKPIKSGNSKNEKSNFVSLCRKDSISGESYDVCEIARLIINYEVEKA